MPIVLPASCSDQWCPIFDIQAVNVNCALCKIELDGYKYEFLLRCYKYEFLL